ncbi:hypothetical protein ET475_10855 [Microbacterium protaetiae]|uniref:Peptidoglycan-binding protein n=1 Tax=Microbacterium protaetiae TaxID=2509458 RepID=A0A4P6EJY9_9MICO|nr:peptidoglycan-binding domain-containing protein [Microbacterium protaetiae]QAY60437.1 hypothetical protein ET475_10855 [Microbacterium protaetiae]
MRRKIAWWTIAAVAVVAVFGGGWFAARAFESPAQRAAHATAPQPGVVTADVTEGDLSRTVSFTAGIQRAHRTTVSLSDAHSGVVTARLVKNGAAVKPGDVVLELNSRPLIAVPGSFPYFRDLTLGLEGRDVRQLQAGLTAAGFPVGVDGVLGAGTVRAVKALYARIGYSAPESPDDVVSDPSAGANDDASEATDTGQPDTAPSDTGRGEASGAREGSLVVPMAELLTVPKLPAYLSSQPAVGQRVSPDTPLVFETGDVVAIGDVEPGVSLDLAEGIAGSMSHDDDAATDVTVAKVGQAAKDGDPVPVTLSAVDDGIPASWLGREALVTLTLEKAAQDSLLVPTSAVVTTGGDDAYVLKQVGDGTFRQVAVVESARLDGKSAVRPLDDHALRVGDAVQVG